MTFWPVLTRGQSFGRGLKTRNAMLHVSKLSNVGALMARLGDAGEENATLVNGVSASLGQTEKTVRLAQLIESRAWTDAALALIDLELPFWQVRRLAYDDGEWYCALSR